MKVTTRFLKMKDGSEHYVNAERLPNYRKHFDRIDDAQDIKAGDVVVVDYPGRGESTAHTEVVTSSDPDNNVLKTTGAHGDGAYEKDWSDLLDGATKKDGYWERPGGDKIYILRPIKLSNPPTPPQRSIRG